VACELGDNEKAVDLASDYLAEYPQGDYAESVYALSAGLLCEAGEYESARLYAAKVINNPSASDEDYARAVIVLGKVMESSQAFNSVTLNYLETAYLKLPPNTVPICALFGSCLPSQGDYQDGSVLLQRLLR
jgi:tetratricopeptide (TPR) repeat protein